MAITDYTCIVNQAGPSTQATSTSSPVVLFNLSDVQGSFNNTWFFAAGTAKNQMLAVALAAVSTQSQVNAWVDTPTPGGPVTECYNLYIIAS